MVTSSPMSSSLACLQTVTYRNKRIIMLSLLYVLQLNFTVLLVYIYVLLLISYMYCMFQLKIKKLNSSWDVKVPSIFAKILNR